MKKFLIDLACARPFQSFLTSHHGACQVTLLLQLQGGFGLFDRCRYLRTTGFV